MWCGIGVDTHHYSEAPGSRMNITHSRHTASRTDGLLACQREGLSCFPSLIDSRGSPSIKSDFLTFNSTEPRKAAIQERSTKPVKPTHQRPLHMNVERHISGLKHILIRQEQRLHLILHKSQAANTKKLLPCTWKQYELLFKLLTAIFSNEPFCLEVRQVSNQFTNSAIKGKIQIRFTPCQYLLAALWCLQESTAKKKKKTWHLWFMVWWWCLPLHSA